MRDMECRPGAEAMPSSIIDCTWCCVCIEAIRRSLSGGMPDFCVCIKGDVAGLLSPSKKRTGAPGTWPCGDPPALAEAEAEAAPGVRLTEGVKEEGLFVPTAGV